MARPPRYLIVYNPTAGRRCSAEVANAVESLLIAAGRKCKSCPTAAPGDAERIVREAATHSDSSTDGLCAVACGGDGTVQEVANAMMNSKTSNATLGVAPAGRCNDFARAMGIGKNPQRIADVLLNGRPVSVDLGRLNDRYFCTVAAVGFDARVSRYVNDMRMPLRGTAAYVFGTLRILVTYHTPHLRLTGEFGDYEGPVFLVSSANTAWYGGSMKIAPDADPTDGRLDICLVGRIAKLRVLRLLPRVMAGEHASLTEVRMLRTRFLTAEQVRWPTDTPPMEVWADGERIGVLPARIDSVRGAIRVMRPA